VAELRPVIIRVAEQIVTKHVVEAALPRLVSIAADVDAFDEFHLLLTCVLNNPSKHLSRCGSLEIALQAFTSSLIASSGSAFDMVEQKITK
jgi:hypothetical protein